jgi:hypothetical protein
LELQENTSGRALSRGASRPADKALCVPTRRGCISPRAARGRSAPPEGGLIDYDQDPVRDEDRLVVV